MSCCNGSQYPAGNPCGSPVANSAACESLPSQITNFTQQFFGSVTKTELDGTVTWVLPCSLDVGLENNPRAQGEGLACYFLRLFNDGIIGATGPQGTQGEAGASGYNGFTITTGQFIPPAVGMAVSIPMAYNPSIVAGQTVFIATSGWYAVNAVDWNSGFVTATYTQTISGAASPVIAGKIVQPTGPQGVTGAIGATGPQGDTGPQGAAGVSTTNDNGYAVGSGSDFALSASYQSLTFSVSPLGVTLGTAAGLYQIQAIVGIEMDSDASTPVFDKIYVRLYNLTSGVAIPGSEQIIQCLGPSQVGQVVVSAHYQPPANACTIVLQAKAEVTDVSQAIATRTQISYVRLE